MSEANKTILKEANAALTAGNTEGFLVFCADNTQWTFVGNKTLKGKETVRQWMAVTYPEPPKFVLDDLIAEGDQVVALGKITTQDKTGRDVHSLYCDVWRFRDGKIVELSAFVIGDENSGSA